MLKQLSSLPAEALLFDLDGTLIDSVPDLAAAIDLSLADLQAKPAGEQYVRGWVGNGSLKLCERALAWHYQCAENELAAADLAAFHHSFLTHYQQVSGQYSCLYAGVSEALTYWLGQGYKMALVTNKPQQFIPHLLKRFELSHYFSVAVGGDTLPQKKPSPEPLLYACEQLACLPASAIMFGDSKTDIAAAKNANMPVVAVTYGYNHGEPVSLYQPQLIVDSLAELIAD